MIDKIIKGMAWKFNSTHPFMSVEDLIQEGYLVNLNLEQNPLIAMKRLDEVSYYKLLKTSLYNAFRSFYSRNSRASKHAVTIEIEECYNLSDEELGAIPMSEEIENSTDLMRELVPFSKLLNNRELDILVELLDPSDEVIEAALDDCRKNDSNYQVQHRHIYEALGLGPKVYYRGLESLRGKYYMQQLTS